MLLESILSRKKKKIIKIGSETLEIAYFQSKNYPKTAGSGPAGPESAVLGSILDRKYSISAVSGPILMIFFIISYLKYFLTTVKQVSGHLYAPLWKINLIYVFLCNFLPFFVIIFSVFNLLYQGYGGEACRRFFFWPKKLVFSDFLNDFKKTKKKKKKKF